MDVAGPAAILAALARVAAVVVLFSSFALTQPSIISQAKDLQAQEQWQALVDLAEPVKVRPPELEYLYGVALAHLSRWDDASAAFERGMHLSPMDARFPRNSPASNSNSGTTPKPARNFAMRSPLRPMIPTPMNSWAPFTSCNAIWKPR